MRQTPLTLLPNGWTRMPLGECAEFVNGRAYSQDELLDAGKPVLRIQNLNGGERWYYSDLKLPEKNYCEAGDLLFAWSASFGPYIWRGPKSIFHYHIWRVLPRRHLDKQFAYYLLAFLTNSLKAAGRGIAMLHITKSGIEAWEVALPPLEEQRRIAAILDAANSVRAKRRAALAKLDQLAQSIFIDMFGDPVSNPMSWPKRPLGELVRIRRGGSPRPIENYLGGTIPWIKIGDATKGDQIYLERTEEHIIPDGLHKTVLLPEGSLIFANCGVSLGFARILKISGCIHDGWLSIEDIPEMRLNKVFLLKLINAVTMYFRVTAPQGTQPNLNTGIMKDFLTITPPIDLQRRFEAIIISIQNQQLKMAQSQDKLNTIFASLQHRAFRGEL